MPTVLGLFHITELPKIIIGTSVQKVRPNLFNFGTFTFLLKITQTIIRAITIIKNNPTIEIGTIFNNAGKLPNIFKSAGNIGSFLNFIFSIVPNKNSKFKLVAIVSEIQ
ncbi:hypothetical protein [Lactobacillus helveticus]|uniref:hypothetical protein n=1 Tax=Lactobacillus helveticus TaxID=1587 RepID=UPI001884A9E8|nr:hypothetical protein [Lactobacillus helveticus]